MNVSDVMIATAYAAVICVEALIIVLAVRFLVRVWLPDYREQRRMHRFTAEQIRVAAERCKRGE